MKMVLKIYVGLSGSVLTYKDEVWIAKEWWKRRGQSLFSLLLEV
jgi:hypothetical protein